MRRLITTMLVCLAFLAGAQTVEQVSPAEIKLRTVVNEPLTLYKGFFRAGASAQYGVVNKYFNQDGKRETLGGSAFASSWFSGAFLQYGITTRLMFDVDIPYVVRTLALSSQLEFPYKLMDSVLSYDHSSKGLGDMSITGGYQIIQEDITAPVQKGLTFWGSVLFPTGRKNPTYDPSNPRSYEQPVGYGEFVVDGSLRYRIVKYPFSYAAGVGYRYHFAGQKLILPSDTEETPFKSGDTFYAITTFNMLLNDWIAVKNFLEFRATGKDEVGGVTEEYNKWLLYYSPGLSFQVKQLRIEQWITIPLLGKVGPADPGFQTMVMYVF